MKKNEVKMYVAARETGDFIDEVWSIEEGYAVIEQFEEHDKAEGIYEDNFYDIVDEERCSLIR